MPSCTPATPEQVIQGLIEAGAVLRDLNHDKLAALARWIDALPAFSLRYSDLDSGLALVESLVVPMAQNGSVAARVGLNGRLRHRKGGSRRA